MSSDTTSRLNLPLLIGGQAQKHLTMNAGLLLLESLVQASVLSRGMTAQPASPADGDSYILPAGATGVDWATRTAGAFVTFENGAWGEVVFPNGSIVHVADETCFIVRGASTWADFATFLTALDNLRHVGIGTAADSTNVLAAKGPAALLSAIYAADGGSGDFSLVVNKEADGDSAQILLQKDFASRAILGLLGDNNLTLKVSPDGSSFTQALAVNGTTGITTFGAPVALPNGSASAPAAALNTNFGMYLETAPLQAGDTALAFSLNGLSNLQLSYSASNGFTRIICVADGLASFVSRTYSNTAAPANSFQRWRGTRAAPAIVGSGDMLGVMNFSGALTTTAASILGTFGVTVIEPTPSATAGGVQAVISLTPLGSVTRAEVLRLENGTGLSMFGANPVIDQNRVFRTRQFTVTTLPSAVTGGMTGASNLGGGAGSVQSDGTNWFRPNDGYETIGDADNTVTYLTASGVQEQTAALTANRTTTLSDTDSMGATVKKGARHIFVRSGAGAFTRTFKDGAGATLYTSASGATESIEFVFSGTAWRLLRHDTL